MKNERKSGSKNTRRTFKLYTETDIMGEERVLAHRWTLLRTEDGWKIKIRKLIPIEGSTDAADLLKQGIEAFADKGI